MRKEREADDLEILAVDGQRNIHCLCAQLLVNSRKRGNVQRKLEREERRVAEIYLTLDMYNIEVSELPNSCKRDVR